MSDFKIFLFPGDEITSCPYKVYNLYGDIGQLLIEVMSISDLGYLIYRLLIFYNLTR